MIKAGKPRVGRFLMPRTGGEGEISYFDTSPEGGDTILYDITTTDRTAAYVKADFIKNRITCTHLV